MQGPVAVAVAKKAINDGMQVLIAMAVWYHLPSSSIVPDHELFYMYVCFKLLFFLL